MTEKQMTYEVGHLLGEVVRLCHLDHFVLQ
jgi:hypothetical protein